MESLGGEVVTTWAMKAYRLGIPTNIKPIDRNDTARE